MVILKKISVPAFFPAFLILTIILIIIVPSANCKNRFPKYVYKVKKLFTTNNIEKITKEFDSCKLSHLEINIQKGNISIKSWNNNKILAEVTKEGSLQELKSSAIVFTEKDNRLQIISKHKDENIAFINLEILVPYNTNLKSVNTDIGEIKVKNIGGSIHTTAHMGDINIENSTNNISVKTGNGNILVKQKDFFCPPSIFLETLSGDISLSIPKNTNSSLSAKTASGKVTSELYIITNPQKLKLNKHTWKQLTKEAYGRLGTRKSQGQITLETDKGNISIQEY